MLVAGGAAGIVVEEEVEGATVMAGTAGTGTGADGEEEDGEPPLRRSMDEEARCRDDRGAILCGRRRRRRRVARA